MLKEAGQVLGEMVGAGALLQPSGTGSRMIRGGAIGLPTSGGPAVQGTTPGGYRGTLYMAVGITKVGFFATKQALTGPKVGELLLEIPRRSIVSLELGEGRLSSPFTIVLEDGTRFNLECAMSYRKFAVQVARLFGAA